MTTSAPPDVDSFEAFVRARSDRMLNTAWLITRDPEDARDAVQDAMVGLSRRWLTLPEGDEFEAYVHRTVVNACLGVIRRRPRSIPVADTGLLRRSPVEPDFTAGLVQADLVWRLCGTLRPKQRAAVVLRFYDGRSFAEIASALRCRESTARSHVNRALAELRRRLSEGDGNG